MNINEQTPDSILEGRRTKGAIYAVENIENGKRLICATRNLSKRLHDQSKYLASGHYNADLQRDLEAAHPEDFRLVILELIDDPKLLPMHKRFHVLEARRCGLCYNIEPSCRKNITIQLTAANTPT